ncbi:MAG: hypothetical protein JRF56_01200 [Deltaproteobacteria bacterium]|jgi:hypothetical protein|nr:hypothetical protein [Deltaproteobacteria bacterium]
MTSPNNQKDAMEKVCQRAIQKHLGDISTLPEELAGYVRQIYSEFIAIYLRLLRQKQDKPADWFPQTWSIDPELADDMRHFFSDYQHITKKFFILNDKLDRLEEIDRERQPNLYRHAIEDILQSATTSRAGSMRKAPERG